jgi:hypothetical protein
MELISRSRQQQELAHEHDGFLLMDTEDNDKRGLDSHAHFKIQMPQGKLRLTEPIRMLSKTYINPLQGRQEIGIPAFFAWLASEDLLSCGAPVEKQRRGTGFRRAHSCSFLTFQFL